jgi:tRNA G26 N,N-dimethylase Trm1
MSVIEECGMLVDELRDDPAFVEALSELRDAISDALAATDTRGIRARYETVAEHLAGIIESLEAQR